jgi:CHAD domain-containing protein
MTTERTAIRSRLAVRRQAHRPPVRAWKVGHRLIVPPLGATIAATLAVGVTVALARAERERRHARERVGKRPSEQLSERQLGLLPGEQLPAGVQRMALGQVDLAIALLESEDDGPPDERAVHETRKALKRLRALVRLLRPELGEARYERENAAIGDVAAHLAGARDAAVMLATLDSLVERHPRQLRRSRAVGKLRKGLAAEHAHRERLTFEQAGARTEVLGELRALRMRIAAWRLSRSGGCALIEPGLKRVYRQGRRRYRRAATGKGDVTRTLHDWRKRVKDLRYAAEMLERRPATTGAAAGAGKGQRRRRKAAAREAARLKRLATRADNLGELLGEEHDLALLGELLGGDKGATGKRARRGKPGAAGLGPARRRPVPPRTRKRLLKLIGRRRRKLCKRALRSGERLYSRSPRRFSRRVRSAYAAAERLDRG